MRSFLIVIATALVVAVAFGIYWSLQPRLTGGPSATAPVIVPTSGPVKTQNQMGVSHRPWVNTYDANGVLKTQFTAAEMDPQPDNSIVVDRPVMIFHMKNGRFIVVTGDNGLLEAPPGGAAKPKGSTPMPGAMSASGRNARLHHVEIFDFPNLHTRAPTMVMQTDNVRYDNDLLQLYTDKYTDLTGHLIVADQVPVVENGIDFDFKGKGLFIQWNGLTKRMQQLKVVHGDTIVLKNTKKLAMPGESKSTNAGPPAKTVATDTTPIKRSNVQLTAMETPVKPVKPKTPATRPAGDQLIYHRAVFNNDVTIFQAAHQSAAADQLVVDFVDSGASDESTAKTKNPLGPATAPAGAAPEEEFLPPDAYAAPDAAQAIAGMSAHTATQPTELPATVPAAATTTATAAKESTKGPVTIKWTGELRVSELTDAPMMPIDPGQMVVRLIGAPARLTPVGSTVTAARATYRTGDGALLAEPSDRVPEVVLVQDKGVGLHTKRVSFDPATSVATLTGPSRLEVPQKKGKPMIVQWTDRGLLHTVGGDDNNQSVDSVDLAGNVSVDHPRFSMNSKTLRLDLEPAAKKMEKKPKATDPDDDSAPQELPRRMIATGDVRARFHGTGGKTQGIDTDKLDVGFARDESDKAYPSGVVADGHVVASDTDQMLTARHLQAVLAEKKSDPATKPTTTDDPAAEVDLVSLLSTGDVHAVTKAKATADSQNLRVTTVAGVRQVELWGDGGATVSDGKGKTLTGSVLHVSPDRNTASVDGAGTIHSIGTPKKPATGTPASGTNAQASATTRPMDVSWTDSMSMDTDKNAVEVVGTVEVRTVDADGGVSIFTGDRAHLDLEDAPKNDDDDQPPADDQSVMGGKQVRMLTMIGHVKGTTLLEANGQIVRRGQIEGDKLIYTVAIGRAEIPGAGRLLIENHKVAGAPVGTKSTGNRGSMAVSWTDSLVYDDGKNEIDIRGNIVGGFAPDGSSGADKTAGPMRLKHADRVLITMKKVPALTGTTRPGQDDQARVQVETVLASGRVQFAAHGGDVDCHTAEFTPGSDRMVARGSDAEPGHASQLPGKAGSAFDGTFDEMVFDTASEEVVSVKGVGAVIRK